MELDHVYRLRKEVFADQEEYLESSDERFTDHFDSFPETVNLLAMEGDRPAGTLRFTLENPVGIPALEIFDFRPFMKDWEGKVASVGWFCVAREYRKRIGIVRGLFKLLTREMRKLGARHAIAPLNPAILPVLERVGAKVLGPEFYCQTHKIPVVPVHVDIARLPPGVKETLQDPVDIVLDESNERRIYQRRDLIFGKGEVGSEAFVIMRGSVRIVPPGGEGTGTTVLLGPGQVFGELALLDDGPRSANVVCHSGQVDVMVWSREEFLGQLSHSPQKALRICQILGRRFRAFIDGTGELALKEALIARILLDASRHGKEPVDARWLAAQSGHWPEQLKTLVEDWQTQGLARMLDENTLVVSDPQGLEQRICID